MQETKQILAQLRFGAKIDFITFSNPRKSTFPLPPLDGRLCWSRQHHYRRFSIHDPSPEDIAKLMPILGPDTPIIEMEVAVDLAPKDGPNLPLLREVMVDIFGSRLCPSASSLRGARRSAYRPHLNRCISLEESPCMSDDQFLIGSKQDAAQVKCYLKRTDQRQQLPDHEVVARVEVRLAEEQLRRLGISALIDLGGFRFRKVLMPYFRHYTPVSRGSKGQAPTRRRRETAINDKIGQALLRLEKRHQHLQSECSPMLGSTVSPAFHVHGGTRSQTL
jgi:hypothetical protein